MTTSRRLVALVVTTVFVVGTACGESLSEQDQALIDAFTEDNKDLTEAGIDGRCVATQMVSALGGAEAADDKYGITPEELRSGNEDFAVTQEDAERIVDGMFECADEREFIAEAFYDLPGFTETDADCVAAEISVDLYRQTFVDLFAGLDADNAVAAQLQAEVRAAAEMCGVDLG